MKASGGEPVSGAVGERGVEPPSPAPTKAEARRWLHREGTINQGLGHARVAVKVGEQVGVLRLMAGMGVGEEETNRLITRRSAHVRASSDRDGCVKLEVALARARVARADEARRRSGGVDDGEGGEDEEERDGGVVLSARVRRAGRARRRAPPAWTEVVTEHFLTASTSKGASWREARESH